MLRFYSGQGVRYRIPATMFVQLRSYNVYPVQEREVCLRRLYDFSIGYGSANGVQRGVVLLTK